MKALVAGGAGFIGSHLCDRLLAEGTAVVCVDNLLTGSVANIQHLFARPDFTFLQHDVSEPLDVAADLVFHLASPASPNPNSPKSYLAHPIATALANSQGTYQLLELARRNEGRFLFASTSEVYGDPLMHPQSETYWGNVNPVGVRSCYDEGKRFGEALAMAYHRDRQMDVRIVRIFNTYGPRLDPEDGRFVPNFISQALEAKPITVYGDGSQTRSLCYVEDLVEGLWRVMMLEAGQGELFNLGNPDERTVLDFARIIRALCGSGSVIVHTPLPPTDDPARRRPDISKARRILGWEPRIELEEGLTRTIAWYRQRLDSVAPSPPKRRSG